MAMEAVGSFISTDCMACTHTAEYRMSSCCCPVWCTPPLPSAHPTPCSSYPKGRTPFNHKNKRTLLCPAHQTQPSCFLHAKLPHLCECLVAVQPDLAVLTAQAGTSQPLHDLLPCPPPPPCRLHSLLPPPPSNERPPSLPQKITTPCLAQLIDPPCPSNLPTPTCVSVLLLSNPILPSLLPTTT